MTENSTVGLEARSGFHVFSIFSEQVQVMHAAVRGVALVFMLGSSTLIHAAGQAALNAVVLKRLPRAQERSQIAGVCAQLSPTCNIETAAAWSNGRTNLVYVVDSQGPRFIIEDPTTSGRMKTRVWDFSDYVEADRRPDAEYSLYPALYPIANNSYALAVVTHITDMYSGGGASFDTADFIEMRESGLLGDVLYKGVPFSCSKMVRACFSEREYRTSKHCHEEWNGYLSIRYLPNKEWVFTWNETNWPAFTAKSQTNVTHKQFTIKTGIATKIGGAEPSFCEEATE